MGNLWCWGLALISAVMLLSLSILTAFWTSSWGPLTVTMSDPESDSGNLIHSQWTGSACSSSSPNCQSSCCGCLILEGILMLIWRWAPWPGSWTLASLWQSYWIVWTLVTSFLGPHCRSFHQGQEGSAIGLWFMFWSHWYSLSPTMNNMELDWSILERLPEILKLK